MTTGRGLRLAIAAMALPLVAAACGSDDDTSTSTSGGSPTAVTTGASSTTTSPAADAQPTVAEDKVVESKPDLTIDVAFPVLAYPGHDATAAKVNSTVRALVDRTVADFRKALADLGPSAGAGSPTSTLSATTDTVRLDGNVASFRLTWDSYYAGAAHPGSHVETATFDLTTGEQLDLADLFTPGAKYLDGLSKACASQVEAALAKTNGQPLDDGERQQVAAGTAPQAENYGAWAVSTTAVEVTFQEYQVGPYAVGRQSCQVKRTDLAGLLKAGGLL